MVLADSSLVEPRSPQVAVNMAGRLMHPPLEGTDMTLNQEKFWMQMNPTLTDEDDEEYMLIDARKTHPLNHVRSEDSEPFDVAKPMRYSYKTSTETSPEGVSHLSRFVGIEPAWEDTTTNVASNLASLDSLEAAMDDDESAFFFRSRNSDGKVDFEDRHNLRVKARSYADQNNNLNTSRDLSEITRIPAPASNVQSLQKLRSRRSRTKGLEISPEKKGNNVSFGEPTLHEFQPDDQTKDSRDTYTREVGKAIKDLTLIGDATSNRPGSRSTDAKAKPKANPKVYRVRKVSSSSPQKSQLPENDPLESVWDIFEGVANNLGINNKAEETKPTTPTNTELSVMDDENSLIHKPNPSRYSSDQEVTFSQDQEVVCFDDNDNLEGFPFPLSTLDKDPDFAKLAFHAAQSMHQLKGVKYNNTYPIDMYADIKISVVELKLPLGLILLENNGGCFVTKISPDGSAARSGGVELGDQLASINGQKSTRMNVDDIYDIIKRSKDSKSVDLAFVRYIGPFRPSRKLESSSKKKRRGKKYRQKQPNTGNGEKRKFFGFLKRR